MGVTSAPHENAVTAARQDATLHRNSALVIAAITVLPAMLANYEARMLLRPDILEVAHKKHTELGAFQISFWIGAAGATFGLWLVYLELRNWRNARQELKRAKATLVDFARNR